jgi:hypothetical protein
MGTVDGTALIEELVFGSIWAAGRGRLGGRLMDEQLVIQSRRAHADAELTCLDFLCVPLP